MFPLSVRSKGSALLFFVPVFAWAGSPADCGKATVADYASLDAAWTYGDVQALVRKCKSDYKCANKAARLLNCGLGLIEIPVSAGPYDAKTGRIRVKLPRTIELSGARAGTDVVHLRMSPESARTVEESPFSVLAVGHRVKLSADGGSIQLRSRVLLQRRGKREVVWLEGCSAEGPSIEGSGLAKLTSDAFQKLDAGRALRGPSNNTLAQTNLRHAASQSAQGGSILSQINSVSTGVFRSKFRSKNTLDDRPLKPTGLVGAAAHTPRRRRIPQISGGGTTMGLGDLRRPKKPSPARRHSVSVELGALSATSTCDKEVIGKTLRFKRLALAGCFTRSTNPEGKNKTSGTLKLSWTIGHSGLVSPVKVERSAAVPSSIKECVRATIEHAPFRKSSPICKVSQTFDFGWRWR